MCGIAGYIGRKKISENDIHNTLKLMRNRGPNEQRFSTFEQPNFGVVLLHSRLSILDLDPRSHQPFVIGNYHLIFNGEIYNYVEVREKLQKQGVEFTTSSDTEVLLRSYIAYGEKCVDHFEGMWSFCIFDADKQQLFLSRDRFAEKPLYYIKEDDGIWFASETKFLKSLRNKDLQVNTRQALRYLINGYKSLYKTSDTFFHEVQELSYATNMTVDCEFNVETKQYWHPKYNPQQEMTLQEAIDGTRERLLHSMEIRLRSDVPVAFCLSGGVDSATLASIAAKELSQDIATFSIIDSDERYNEYDLIKATVDDTKANAHFIHISRDNFLPKLEELIKYHDAPVATITYYIHSLLSETISQNGYKVVFSGTAADELFTGYYDHYLLHLYEMRDHPQFERYVEEWRTHVSGFVRNPHLRNSHLFIENPQMRDHVYFKSDEFASYLHEQFTEEFCEMEYSSSLLRKRMMNELFHEATRVILHEDDLNSMKYSIENRSPYLDKNLFEFAYTIPPQHLINDGFNKYILREAGAGILNDSVRLERKKRGFNAAIASLVDFQDPQTREFLLDKNAIVFDIIKREKIVELFSMSPIPNSYSKFLFNFINLRIFLGT